MAGYWWRGGRLSRSCWRACSITTAPQAWPWPAFAVVVTAVAYRIGGWRLGLFALGTLLFIVVGGVWHQAMLSIYLCGAGIIIAFTIGAPLRRVGGPQRPGLGVS